MPGSDIHVSEDRLGRLFAEFKLDLLSSLDERLAKKADQAAVAQLAARVEENGRAILILQASDTTTKAVDRARRTLWEHLTSTGLGILTVAVAALALLADVALRLAAQ